ncbi:MAG: GNAT family protein [Candidatus Eisenbacteria bacterium]
MSERLAPVVLEGARVRLEPLTLDHVAPLAELALDPLLWEWTVSNVTTVEELRAYVVEAIRQWNEGSALPFATIDRASGRVVGSTRFGNYEATHKRIEIGWTTVARDWQRTATNTEAKLLMLGHAFDTLRLARVELKTDALNARSRAAIARLGAREEGTLRRHVITDTGRVRDTVYYSILDDEWPAVRAALEARLARGA